MTNSDLKNGINGDRATEPYNDAFDVLKDLTKNAEAFRAGDKKAKDALVSDCFRMIASLETPGELFTRMLWAYTLQPPILRLASDMKIFENLKEPQKTTTELAEAGGLDPNLTRKVLKNLATYYAVKEVDVDVWGPTPFSTSMAETNYKNALALMVPYTSHAQLKTPEYFAETNYQWPSSALDAPVQYAKDVRGGRHFFEIMKRDGQMNNLEALMKVWLDQRPHWSDEAAGYYPVRERLIKGADNSPDSVFLVDVGGGHGQDFPRLLANVPQEEIPGRLVLQDTPDVIAEIAEGSLPATIECTGYDFFTPQPIHGARVYFMHSILHNHPDDRCISILKQLTTVMKKGYSKLLLWDNVMPDKGASASICALDWVMLTFYAASERTETEWRKLLEHPEVGLKITDIVHYSQYDQDLIELELA